MNYLISYSHLWGPRPKLKYTDMENTAAVSSKASDYQIDPIGFCRFHQIILAFFGFLRGFGYNQRQQLTAIIEHGLLITHFEIFDLFCSLLVLLV